MRKLMVFIASFGVILLFALGCSKDKATVDYSQIDFEKVKIKSTLDLTKAYSDTLKMGFDTAKVKKGNTFCLKYDKLYHRDDSMFTVHYTMFGDMMYQNGMMLNHYTPMGGMGGMVGGSMGSMDMNIMMADTAMVGGYYRAMHTLQTQHQTYHNAIYN